MTVRVDSTMRQHRRLVLPCQLLAFRQSYITLANLALHGYEVCCCAYCWASNGAVQHSYLMVLCEMG
ncbi:hypothetical protein KDM88_17295 [Undibacterium sp. BYS50W]|nr:hypothetical protein [Undibacterium rugosum]